MRIETYAGEAIAVPPFTNQRRVLYFSGRRGSASPWPCSSRSTLPPGVRRGHVCGKSRVKVFDFDHSSKLRSLIVGRPVGSSGITLELAQRCQTKKISCCSAVRSRRQDQSNASLKVSGPHRTLVHDQACRRETFTLPMPLSSRFSHIVFPHELARRHLVNVAMLGEPRSSSCETRHTWQDDEFRFVSWLFEQAHLDASEYRVEALARRLTACFRLLRVSTADEARQMLERVPGQIASALDTMLVGVTSFFRDPAIFDMLYHQAIPQLFNGQGGHYVWSAGCSDGAELYTLAMLFHERDLLRQTYLLGTDCRSEAIARAKRGIYPESALRDTPPDFCRKWFTRQGNTFEISRELRTMVRWRTSSVLSECEPGLWDLILFRNTAIYFHPKVIPSLWKRLEAALRPGGILVLGRAERPMGATRLHPIGACMYRKRGGRGFQ